MVIMTSPANFAKLDRLREVNLRISDPRGLTEAQARALTEEGKAVVVQSMSMHATEIGGTQMAPELAYDLMARKDEEARRILVQGAADHQHQSELHGVGRGQPHEVHCRSLDERGCLRLGCVVQGHLRFQSTCALP